MITEAIQRKVLEYAKLKKHLASIHIYIDDRVAYTRNKSTIHSVIELAKKRLTDTLVKRTAIYHS